jgi:hypothetical protein
MAFSMLFTWNPCSVSLCERNLGIPVRGGGLLPAISGAGLGHGSAANCDAFLATVTWSARNPKVDLVQYFVSSISVSIWCFKKERNQKTI